MRNDSSSLNVTFNSANEQEESIRQLGNLIESLATAF